MKPGCGRALGMAVVVSAVCSACNSSGSLDTVAAGGQVTYLGAPLAGATVTLVPAGGQRPAVGITDISGQFQVTTLVAGDGAMPGAYKVTVTKTQESVVPVTKKEMSLEEMRKIEQEMMGSAPPTGEPPKHLLPTKYASADATPLTCEVPASGTKDLKFELTN